MQHDRDGHGGGPDRRGQDRRRDQRHLRFLDPAPALPGYHGGLRILSESASARLATPIEVKPTRSTANALGYNAPRAELELLEPWPGGDVALRDIVEYQLIAMESCLYQAAVRREDLLRAFYSVGQRATSRTEPFAFVIPAEQCDPGAARKML